MPQGAVVTKNDDGNVLSNIGVDTLLLMNRLWLPVYLNITLINTC